MAAPKFTRISATFFPEGASDFFDFFGNFMLPFPLIVGTVLMRLVIVWKKSHGKIVPSR